MASGWYPGHMVATQKTIREIAPYLTAFLEVVDARAPELTRHRPLTRWVGKTPIVLVLNKSDLAEKAVTDAWLSYYRQTGTPAVSISAASPKAANALKAFLSQRFHAPLRLSVVGLPNIGKSTVLNRMVGSHKVATGAKPGLTRGPQWIRREGGWEWLDLPGVVTPSKTRDWRLQLLGVVPIESDDGELVADNLWNLYHPGAPEEDWLQYGKERGFLQRGGGIDRTRTADALIVAFRRGALGPISLERPRLDRT